jgi:hypothetical protein
MVIVRGVLRIVLIWILSRVAAPYVRRGFAQLAKLTPDGSFLEATLLEMSTAYSAMLVTVVAELVTAVIIESIDFLFMLAAALRLRPISRTSSTTAKHGQLGSSFSQPADRPASPTGAQSRARSS